MSWGYIYVYLFILSYSGSLWLWRLLSSCSVWASYFCGLSCGAQALGFMDVSSFGTWAQQLRLPGFRAQYCVAQAELVWGMWNLPGSGIEPVSPALTGGFFAPEPAAEPLHLCLLAIFFLFFEVATCCSVTQLCLTLCGPMDFFYCLK